MGVTPDTSTETTPPHTQWPAIAASVTDYQMLLRLLIVGCALLALVLSASLWLLSHHATITVERNFSHGGVRSYGGVRVLILDGGLYFIGLPGGRQGVGYLEIEPAGGRPDVAPFYLLGGNAGRLQGGYFLRIPFWLLTSLATVPLFIVWRQSRSKRLPPGFEIGLMSDPKGS